MKRLQPTEVRNVTGGTTTVTKHFYANGMQVAKLVGSTTYYLHQDALGSTRLVATASVTIKFSSNYVPYGNNYGITGKEVFMYTGKPQDSATGLYYYGARYYDPTVGRFVTQDSVPGSKEDPMSLDRYIYARDNPEHYVDPSGHDFWSWVSSGASTLAGALTSTVTDVTNGIAGGVTSVASTAVNAWNSLPPQYQALVLTAVIVTAAVATGGAALAATPLIAGTMATGEGIGTLAAIGAGIVSTSIFVPSVAVAVSTANYYLSSPATATPNGVNGAANQGLQVGITIDTALFKAIEYGTHRPPEQPPTFSAYIDASSRCTSLGYSNTSTSTSQQPLQWTVGYVGITQVMMTSNTMSRYIE